MGFLNNLFKKKDNLAPDGPPGDDDIKLLGNSLEPPPWEETQQQNDPATAAPQKDNVNQQLKQESKNLDMKYNDMLVDYDKPTQPAKNPIPEPNPYPDIPDPAPMTSQQPSSSFPDQMPDTSMSQPPSFSPTEQPSQQPGQQFGQPSEQPLPPMDTPISPPVEPSLDPPESPPDQFAQQPEQSLPPMDAPITSPADSSADNQAHTPASFPSDIDHDEYSVKPRHSLFSAPTGPVESKPVPLHNAGEGVQKLTLPKDEQPNQEDLAMPEPDTHTLSEEETLIKSREILERAKQRHAAHGVAHVPEEEEQPVEQEAEGDQPVGQVADQPADQPADQSTDQSAVQPQGEVQPQEGQSDGQKAENTEEHPAHSKHGPKFTIEKRPIFLSLADVRRLTKIVGGLHDGIKATEDAILRAEEINNDTEMLYEKWREELEAAEERIVGFDKSMFSS